MQPNMPVDRIQIGFLVKEKRRETEGAREARGQNGTWRQYINFNEVGAWERARRLKIMGYLCAEILSSLPRKLVLHKQSWEFN